VCVSLLWLCVALVRAGKQAEVLNQVIGELLEGHPVSDVKLKEVLGHTPLQVRRGMGMERGVCALYVGFHCCAPCTCGL
jgi:acid phosphatase family membrane protein YuiD